MNHKHRPNLEKLIKNASEILKVKPEYLPILSPPPMQTNLLFIRDCERIIKHDRTPKSLLATPQHRRKPSKKVNNQTPEIKPPSLTSSPKIRRRRCQKLYSLIDHIDDIQFNNKHIKLVNFQNPSKIKIKELIHLGSKPETYIKKPLSINKF